MLSSSPVSLDEVVCENDPVTGTLKSVSSTSIYDFDGETCGSDEPAGEYLLAVLAPRLPWATAGAGAVTTVSVPRGSRVM